MFALDQETPIDQSVAEDLVVITDELFDSEDGINVGNAFSYLLVRHDNEGPGPVVMTLLVAASRLLGLFEPTDRDRAVAEGSDAVAEWVMGQVWGHLEDVELAKAVLRTVLDDGSMLGLSEDMRKVLGAWPDGPNDGIAGYSGVAVMVALARLVTGMSAVKARALENAHAGDPLRRVLQLT